MLERRRYYRLKDGVTLNYKLTGVVVNSPGVNAQDVGGGGVRVHVFERIKPGTSIEVSLRLPDEKESLWALARVAWQTPEPAKDKLGKSCYETGVEFLKMNLKDRLQVIHYVYGKIRQNAK